MQKIDKAMYLLLLFKFILSERLSNSLQRSDILLFSEFINRVYKYSITFPNSLYYCKIFLVIPFAR